MRALLARPRLRGPAGRRTLLDPPPAPGAAESGGPPYRGAVGPPPEEPTFRADHLVEDVYRDLHARAERLMQRQVGPSTLQPTALVHETWLRLAGSDGTGRFESPLHFYSVAALAMRQVLLNHARDARRLKRQGSRGRVTLSGLDLDAAGGLELDDLLDLDRALEGLRKEDAELARLVDLRFFAGLDHPRIAQALGLSLSTVERRWRVARAFLRRELRGAEATE